MNELFKIILSLSLSGTILIFLLLLLRPLYKERLSKRWQYYIWLLVIVRFLLPLTPETSVVGNLFRQTEQRIEQNTMNSTRLPSADSPGSLRTERAPSTELVDIGSPGSAAIEAGGDSYTPPVANTANNKLRIVISENILFSLGALWLVVALLLFVRKITIYQSFVKYVNAGSVPVEDMNLLERFGRILADNHVHGTIDLRANSLVASPLLIGFMHARIILPTTDLSEEDFYYTILHELTHYKRKDMFYKWLVQLTICLHWFNPFVYLMGRETNRLCELSCDERVIASFPEHSRKSYGDTLLHAISTGGSYKDAIASVTLNESKELLKGRLDAIMKYKKIPKTIQTAAIFITGILIGGAVVLGAYAAPNAKSSSQTDEISKSGKTESSSLPDYTIQYEDGVYYIMVGDATEDDKPISSVTNGYKKLVLVREDYYATFGTFDDHDMTSLVNYITEQCNTRLDNNEITQENANIVIQAAEEIQHSYSYRALEDDDVILYNYTQSGYYQHPYLIWIGYNLPANAQSKYNGTLLTLSDQSTMPVWFNEESKKFMSDENAVSAVTTLIERMKSQKADSSRPVEAPIITSIEYVGDTDINTLAEKYYTEDELTHFSAIFPELDSRTQQEYLDHMFENDRISFFSCCIGELEDTNIQKDAVERYTLKAYEEDKINFFAVLSGMLDESSQRNWLEKCKKDGKTNFSILLEEDDYSFDDFLDKNFPDADLSGSVFTDDDFFNSDFTDDDFPDNDFLDEWNDFQKGWEEHEQQQKEITNLIELNRLTKQELSTELQTFLDSCDDRKWYLIDTGSGLQYLYYNGLPHTYAYEPNIIKNVGANDRVIIDIVNFDFFNTPRDRVIEENLGNYVLLAFSYTPDNQDAGYSLEVTYNGLPVTYEIVQSR